MVPVLQKTEVFVADGLFILVVGLVFVALLYCSLE